MTREESRSLVPGLYRVFWVSSGSSLAAIGIGRNGDRWVAPVNWVEPIATETIASFWDDVKRVQLIQGA